MFGRKTCGSITDIKVVCPKCLKRYFFTKHQIKDCARDNKISAICPHCVDYILEIDLSEHKEWYGGDPNAKSEPTGLFDVLYVGTRKVLDEAKEIFKDYKLEETYDGIHEYRLNVTVPGNKRKEYLKDAFVNFYSVSFYIQTTLTNMATTEQKDELKEILEEVKKETNMK